jgi:hypothetical protein
MEVEELDTYACLISAVKDGPAMLEHHLHKSTFIKAVGYNGEDGKNPLHVAAELGRADAVHMLLHAGAKVDAASSVSGLALLPAVSTSAGADAMPENRCIGLCCQQVTQRLSSAWSLPVRSACHCPADL